LLVESAASLLLAVSPPEQLIYSGSLIPSVAFPVFKERGEHSAEASSAGARILFHVFEGQSRSVGAGGPRYDRIFRRCAPGVAEPAHQHGQYAPVLFGAIPFGYPCSFQAFHRLAPLAGFVKILCLHFYMSPLYYALSSLPEYFHLVKSMLNLTVLRNIIKHCLHCRKRLRERCEKGAWLMYIE
jgi:hypothetical protein